VDVENPAGGCYLRILIVIKSTSKSGQPNDSNRKALLIRCTSEEAQQIRKAAERERRTISGFILNTVMNRITVQHRVHQRVAEQVKKKSTGA